MKYACNWLKHQNNQKKYFHNFEVGQRVLGFGQAMVKYIIELKRYIKKLLWDRSQSNCYSGTDPLLQGTGPML